MMNEKRKMEKKGKIYKKQHALSNEDFDWKKLLNDRSLAKQHIIVLDKYIEKHSLFPVRKKRKPQKVIAIIVH